MTTPVGKSYWPFVAAVGLGIGFVSYCFYFDQKRRNAPDFREKLRASAFARFLRSKRKSVFLRFAERLKQKHNTGGGGASANFSADVNNPDEMRQFFLEQIQKGEDCLSRGQ